MSAEEVLTKGPSEVAVPATSKEALALYENVVDAAELVAVQLRDVKFNVDRDFYGQRDISLGYGVKNGDVSLFLAEGFAGIQIHLDLTAKSGRKKYISCTATYEVLYRGIEGCEEKAVRGFLGRVGRFTAYPYFRALVGHLSDTSGAHLPPLPVLKEKVLPNKKRKPAPEEQDRGDN